ncbi:hypothetical protein A3B18_02130 [Candidatus Giovannonibacteria bacterium RIFCSPLOWO2_01_FULL_46_13]|uniref:glucose-6-phosphate isomerase n=1 Tax=Candidatus Giovannonibacteria bacterium RIFCSPLOWO2_01_FULL_46_13 TaxID=1798352 RepID=A0A1F5X5L2_9BACT|nr:MAG: hypothetical protein A3B18_02130 [Candidatus Giovannonibacteria bacterium RIFCSPLOWO2_01_FULL_46_13]
MSGKFSKRTIKELSPVLFELGPVDRVVYEVERDIDNIDGVRYDETTIFPGLIGRELPKTFGHYHPKNPSGVYYPEIYTVLDGRAWYLIQRPSEDNPRVIEEIYLVETAKGQKAIMPPGFGHVSMNPEDRNLKMANWIGPFEYDYQTYEDMRGSAYYILQSPNGEVRFEKNPQYEKVPDLIRLEPKEIPELGITWDASLLDMKDNPKNLEFLIKPEKYLNLLTIENCFQKII